MLKHTTLLFLLVGLIFLSACGSNKKAMTEFNARMNDFKSTIQATDVAINAIDPYAPNSFSQLIDHLNTMADALSELSSSEVPKDYEEITNIAALALERLNFAISEYERVHDSGEMDFIVANNYYTQCNQYIHEIWNALELK